MTDNNDTGDKLEDKQAEMKRKAREYKAFAEEKLDKAKNRVDDK